MLQLIELGDCDYADVLRKCPPTRWDLPMVFGQMIEAVHFLHEAGIVHTDLKPANFLMVGDSIKIIDLGIAQKIPMGTIHISRDALVGTPNYMAPEAIMSSRSRGKGKHAFKAGKASDVWSMGCIMYQLVYGRPPFDKLTGEAKLQAITNRDHRIEFPDHRVRDDPNSEVVDDDLKDIISRALQYRVADRATLPDILRHPALAPYSHADERVSATREDMFEFVTRVKRLVLTGGIVDGNEPQMVEVSQVTCLR
jgi:serine/threonine protein kinase